MLLRFTKMHGLGNDFVVIDALSQRFYPTKETIRFLADRHRGIGCDQVLIVEPPQQSDVDFRYRIFNADGSEVEQCGNGARCFAKFIQEKKLIGKPLVRVETLGGILELEVLDEEKVRVNMGVPRLKPKQVPFVAEKQAERYDLDVAGQKVKIAAISMGNPHAVLFVDDVSNAPVKKLGKAIETHERFPEKVNVGFLQIINSQHAKLRVFERGVGETQACGSGACAAAVAGIINQKLDKQVTISLLGGDLTIEWAGLNKPLYMTGPAVTVFEGKIKL